MKLPKKIYDYDNPNNQLQIRCNKKKTINCSKKGKKDDPNNQVTE